MATISPEQFAQLLALLQPQGHGVRRIIDFCNVKLHDYGGQASGWADWAFGFKRAIRSCNPDLFRLMERVERSEDAPSEEDLSIDDQIPVDVDRASAELYDALCQTCVGEAMAIVRGVEDCQGLVAWYRLAKTYNPKTMARAIRLMTEVASPTPVKDLKEVDQALTMWEQKVRVLDKDFGEKVSEPMKTAIVTSMLPSAIQDFIYTHIDGMTGGYNTLIDRVRTMVRNKVAMMSGGPVPMDIGEVAWDAGRLGEHEENDEYVGAVGAQAQCFRCGGWGHMARECPSKGKGAGNDKGG